MKHSCNIVFCNKYLRNAWNGISLLVSFLLGSLVLGDMIGVKVIYQILGLKGII